MKKAILFSLASILLMGGLSAQEMQLSGGFEFGLGTFKVDNDFAFTQGQYAYLIKEETTTAFFAPGLSFSVRCFPNFDSNIGFLFRDRSIFITNGKTTGTGSVNGVSAKISEGYSIADDTYFISIMDFDLGPSIRFILSERLQFYTDLGVNLTIMESEDDDTGDTLDYWGMGIFSVLALQVNLTKMMYLEFGITSIINVVSSQKGKVYFDDQKLTYEDTGRFDLISSATYIHVGWRLDVEKIRNRNIAPLP